MKYSVVEFEADDGKYDDGEEHQQRDLKERSHRFDDGFQYDLKTWNARDEFERAENAYCAQRSQVEAVAAARYENGDETGDYHSEVHDVPYAAQIGVLVQAQAERNDFQRRFNAKYGEEIGFGRFLFIFF